MYTFSEVEKILKEHGKSYVKKKKVETVEEQQDRLDKKIIEGMYVKSRTQQLYIQLQNGDYDKDKYPLMSKIETINKYNLANQKKAATSNYYMVTVNLPLKLDEFVDVSQLAELEWTVEKYCRRRKKFIVAAKWVYEFHTENGGHVHCHILVYTAGSADHSTFIKNTKSTFRRLEKHYPPFNVDQIRPFAPLDIAKVVHVSEKIDYIHGIKEDEEKQYCADLDRVLREEIGLEHVYEDGDFPEPGLGILVNPQENSEDSDDDFL